MEEKLLREIRFLKAYAVSPEPSAPNRQLQRSAGMVSELCVAHKRLSLLPLVGCLNELTIKKGGDYASRRP